MPLLLDNVWQIVNATHALEFHAGDVLQSSAPDQHDVVFLQVVADAGHIRDHLLPRRQPHQHALSVRRVRLSRFFDQHLQDDSLGEGLTVERLTRWTILEMRAGFVHSVHGRHVALGYRC